MVDVKERATEKFAAQPSPVSDFFYYPIWWFIPNLAQVSYRKNINTIDEFAIFFCCLDTKFERGYLKKASNDNAPF